MPEGLQDVSGKPLDLTPAEQTERDFASAMSAPVVEPTSITPPPDHGKTMPAERPKRGRPPKAKDGAKPQAKVAEVIKDSYTDDAAKLVGSIWAVAASVPPTQAYALVLHNAADGLAAALAEGAKVNPTIRRAVAGGGNVGWQLQLAGVAVTMGMQAMQLMKDPALRAQCAEQTRAQLKEAMTVAGLDTQTDAHAA
jgi:hypothetical protein